MVFLTLTLLMRKNVMVPYPGQKWKKQMQWRLAWRFRGRVRNCYGLSKVPIKRSLMNSTVCRTFRRSNIVKIFSCRIAAGCAEHGIQYSDFMKSLYESHIMLNKNMLSHFAIYEPRTFQSLCEFVKKKHSESVQKGLATVFEPTPSGIITRDMINKTPK